MWGFGGILGVGVAAVWSVVLGIVDTRERRLPDALTLPAAALALVWALAVEPAALVGLAWPALYAFVGVAQGGVGGGDVKLAVSLGLATTICAGPLTLAAAIVLASVATLIAAAVKRQRTMPHGPGMLVGAWVAVISAFLFAQ